MNNDYLKLFCLYWLDSSVLKKTLSAAKSHQRLKKVLHEGLAKSSPDDLRARYFSTSALALMAAIV